MDWAQVATLAGVFVGAAIGAFVGYRGRPGAKAPEKEAEIVGALVDAGAIRVLTQAVEAHNVIMVEAAVDDEKARKVGHELVEALGDVVKELGELRRAAADVAREIARK